MFAVTPYSATRHAVVMRGGATIEEWQTCRVIGIDAARDEAYYIVEMRSEDGTFYIDRADMIRKPAPSS